MTTPQNPYAQPQQERTVLTRGAAADLRAEAREVEAKSRRFLMLRATNEQQIASLTSECESLARLSEALDATAASYRALLAEAGHPQEDPNAQQAGPPSTGSFQAQDPVIDPALGTLRPSKARDQMPAANAAPRSEGR